MPYIAPLLSRPCLIFQQKAPRRPFGASQRLCGCPGAPIDLYVTAMVSCVRQNKYAKVVSMPDRPKLLLNAFLGAMAVGGGLWLLQGGLSPVVTVTVVVGLMVVFAKTCPGVAQVWTWSTLLLGLESLAWPFLLLGELRQFGPEPPLEEMSRVFNAVLFGVFSGIFWLTFAYGLYRRTRSTTEKPPSPLTPNQAKARRKKQQ